MFWESLLLAPLSGAGTAAVLGVLLLAVLLLQVAKAERRTVLIAGAFFLLSVAALIAAAYLPGRPGGTLRSFSLFAAGLCVIALLGIAIFRAALPALRIATPRIFQDVVVAGSYLVWGLIVMHHMGVNLTSIIATSAVVTAVIGFSLQDTLGNILGGMSIQLDQSIRVGDWVKVDDVVGRVVEVRWRQTSIETRNWETVVVPNSQLVKNRFSVLGRRQGQPLQWRRWVWFNVDFRYAPTQVIGTVQDAIRSAEIPRVAREPQPNCVLMDFAESYGRYAVRYWLTDLAADDPTDSEVRAHIYSALRRAEIPLSIPAHALFVTEETAERKASKVEQALERRLGALRGIDLFASLQAEELERLAARLSEAPFTHGDVITRQGAKADWLYILTEGHADVIVEDGKGHSLRVAGLGPGDFFGEMGLMTGEPRSATVLAATDVACYRLDRDSFQDIVRSRPAIAEEIARALAQRRLELDSALGRLDEEKRAKQLSRAQSDLLARIRRFFSLEEAGR